MKIRTFTTDFDIVSLDFGKRGEYIVYSTLSPQGSQGRTYRIEVDHITTDTPNQVRAEAYRVRSIGRSFPGYDFTHYSTKTTILFPLTDTYSTYREYLNPQSGTATTLKTLNPGTNATAMSTTARQPLRITDLDADVITRRPGDKQYELTDHLGNVRFVLSDRKLTGGAPGDAKGNYDAEMLSATDYYPFGMGMPGRTFNSSSFCYGYNGKDKDDEWSGSGNMYNYGFRIYNPRVSRFLSVDPITAQYPWLTPYQYASNNPIAYIDIDGLEGGSPARRPSRPRLRNINYRNNRQLYALNVIRRQVDFQRIVRNNIRKQNTFQPQVEIVENLGIGNPITNNPKGRAAFHIGEFVGNIKSYEKTIDLVFTTKYEDTAVEVGSNLSFLGDEESQQAFLGILALEKEYQKDFNAILLGDRTQEEFDQLSLDQQAQERVMTKFEMGQSPLEQLSNYIEDQEVQGNVEVLSETTQRVPAISPTE